MNDKCVYFHINPLKSHIFYVGIGSIKRPYTKYKRNIIWQNIVNKYGYIIDIAHTDLSWESACNLEKFYINKLGRKDLKKGNLVNLTDGGDGNVGLIHSDEMKAKMKGNKNGASRKNYTHSEETREKMSIALKGRVSPRKGQTFKHTDEAKLKISLAQLGKKRPRKNII